MRSLFRLALAALGLLVGVRLWATLAGRRQRSVHYLSGPRQVRLLFWPLAGLVASLPFAAAVARRVTDLPGPALAAAAALAGVLLSLSVPALVLHARYRRHDGATVVVFDPKADVLEIRRPDRPFLNLHRRDVRAALLTQPTASRAFWAAYETLQLDFTASPANSTSPTERRPLLLTSAVLDLAPLAEWLRSGPAAVTTRRRWLAWV